MFTNPCPAINLPDEILAIIFKDLDLPELLNVSLVCKKWYRATFDPDLWVSQLERCNLEQPIAVASLRDYVIFMESRRVISERRLREKHLQEFERRQAHERRYDFELCQRCSEI